MKRFVLRAAAIAALSCGGSPAFACRTGEEPVPPAELAARAEASVRVVVEMRIASADPRTGVIRTRATCRRLETLKGAIADPRLEVAWTGGVVGDLGMKRTGEPELLRGDEYLLFLVRGDGGWRILCGKQGAFRKEERDGRSLWVRCAEKYPATPFLDAVRAAGRGETVRFPDQVFVPARRGSGAARWGFLAGLGLALSLLPRGRGRLAGGLRALLVALLPAALVFDAFPYAYSTSNGNPVRWSSGDFPVAYRINALGSDDIADDSELQAVQNAFGTWEALPSATAAFTYAGTTAATAGQRDGLSVVSWKETSWDGAAGAAAYTTYWYQVSDGRIVEADVTFNGADLTWTVGAQPGRFDVQTVATHEAGHVCGLDHSAVADAVMYVSLPPNSTAKRTLHADDVEGISFLYPSGVSASSSSASPGGGSDGDGGRCFLGCGR